MGKFQDLTGQRFGRLTVVERASDYVSPNKHKLARWLCRCDCGNNIIAIGCSLKRKSTQSCGCLQKELAANKHTTHSKYGCRLYRIWIAINQRCNNPKNNEFNAYGGRGITVCEEWNNNFQVFYDWALRNGYADNLTIDRINVNGNYEPSNCKWATRKEQANNTRRNRIITYNGKTQTLTQWADELKISYATLSCRINRYHWSEERALSTTPMSNGGKND